MPVLLFGLSPQKEKQRKQTEQNADDVYSDTYCIQHMVYAFSGGDFSLKTDNTETLHHNGTSPDFRWFLYPYYITLRSRMRQLFLRFYLTVIKT